MFCKVLGEVESVFSFLLKTNKIPHTGEEEEALRGVDKARQGV
jgi:hypothetical protein